MITIGLLVAGLAVLAVALDAPMAALGLDALRIGSCVTAYRRAARSCHVSAAKLGDDEMRLWHRERPHAEPTP
jgi:hypothetical protein